MSVNNDQLVQDIYLAATKPNTWYDVIPEITSHIGGHAAAIGTGFVGNPRSHKVHNAVGIDSELLKIYNQRYDVCNPWFLRPHQAALAGRKFDHRPVRAGEFISGTDMEKTSAYNESLLPMGLSDLIAIPLHQDRSFCALYFFCDTKKKQFSDSDFANAQNISFHLANAYRLMNSTDPAWQYLENEDSCPEELSAILVTSDFTVLDISQNGSSHAGLKKEHGYISGGKYLFSSPHIQESICKNLINRAEICDTLSQPLYCFDNYLSISTRCRILRFTPGSFKISTNKEMMRYLIIFETENALEDSLKLLSNAFSLTKSESEIIFMHTIGLSNRIICLQRGISEHTLRSHTKNIRRKVNMPIKQFTELIKSLDFLPEQVTVALRTS